MSNSQGPEPTHETAVDLGVGGAVPAPLPIGGLLWIPAAYLVLATVLAFGTLEKSMQAAMDVPGAAPVSGTPTRGPSVTPVVAAIQFVNFVVPLFLSIKFFQRRRYIPLLVTAYSVFGAVYAFGLGQAFPARGLVYRLVSTALLVSYLSLSKRVKRTFLL